MIEEFTTEVPLAKIFWLEATDITEQQIHDMAASIMIHGQVEPIVVCTVEKGDRFRGVCGRLRYEGMKYRWRSSPEGKTILTRVHPFKDEVEVKMWQMVENLHRREVPPMQKALQYRQLYDLLKKDGGEEATIQTLVTAIQEGTGDKESKQTVQHYLSLTKLQPETQQVLTSERMPLRFGLELLRIDDPKLQVKAAKDIEKRPDMFRNVQAVKWHVEEFITDQQRDKQRKRLNKKAEELRKQGKTVIIEAPYGDEKDRTGYSTFYGEVPENCKECVKKGVILSGNFQQKPMCTDPKCRRERDVKENREKNKEQKEATKDLDAERAKVYDIPFDVRHWRVAVIGLIDEWELRHVFPKIKEGSYVNRDKMLWMAVSKLTLEECQMILIRKAVEDVLTGPRQWKDDDPAKEYLVLGFNLKPELFLKPEKT